jgi:uncharacterized membrane protein
MAAHFAPFSRAIIVEEYRSIFKEAGLSSDSKLTFQFHALLIFLSQDVVFLETKNDLSVYYEDYTTIFGIPAPCGVVASKLTYDIDEWVGERLFFP